MSKFNYVYTDPSTTGHVTNSTVYGIYDGEAQFISESLNACKWVARRLGHPVMQLEFHSGSIISMFEEAVSEYSTHINNYNIKNWMWNSYGAETTSSASDLTGTGSMSTRHAHLGSAFYLSKQYGEAIGIGGDVTLYSASISLSSSKQTYDLTENVPTAHTASGIEIQKVFNYGPSAISRFYDPYGGAYDQNALVDAMGMGSVSPAVTFVLRPISYDISRAQAIETSDKVRKSNYSFEIVNNKMRIFPMPTSTDSGSKIWFEYYQNSDKLQSTRTYTDNKVTDPSNIPYKFIPFGGINSSGRQWIRKFTLALSKELLGIIRSKYSAMPIPNGEVSMDGESLKSEGREEKVQLLEELKEFLESVSLTEKSKAEAEEAEANQQVLNKAPLPIFIG